MADSNLKIIGWVYEYDDLFEDFDTSDNYDEVYNIILNDIIDHGYETECDFSGSFELCPVFNNGCKVRMSARGWESLTYEAMQTEKYSKMQRYNRDHGKSNEPCESVDITLLDGYDGKEYSFEIPKFHDNAFDCSYKKFEIRPISPETEKVKKFDYLYFNDKYIFPDQNTTCFSHGYVIKIFKGKNFEEVIDKCGTVYYDNLYAALGYSEAKSEEEVLELLYAAYPREEVEKSGAVLFIITPDI